MSDPVAVGPPRYRWTILAVGVGATVAISALRLGLPSLSPALRDEFALSLPQVGLVLSTVHIGIVLTLYAWGAWSDRVGERLVLVLGLSGAAAALTLAAFAPSFEALLAGLVLAGMLGASATGASGRAVMGWFPRSERATALGTRQMAIPIGGAMSALVLPLVAVSAGLGAAFGLLAAGCLVAAVASAKLMREPPPAPASRPAHVGPVPLRDARVWRLATGSLLLICGQVCLLGFLVLFLHDDRGLAVGQAAGVLAAILVIGGLLRITVGRRSDRSDRRVAPLRRLGLLAAVLVAAAAALTQAPLWVLLPVLIAAGVACLSWNGLSFTAAAEFGGRDHAGSALGIQNTVLSLGGVVLPTAFGFLVEASSWGVGFGAIVVFQLAGLMVLGPLVGEEEDRARRRERRLAGAPLAPVRSVGS